VSGQGHRARRRAQLSQHFLGSRALAASLVAQSSISRDDVVIEIGPGRGTLTREKARRCRHLIGVEIDAGLVAGLSTKFRAAPNVGIVHGGFMRFSLPDAPYKVFANIPYAQTASIIRRLVGASVPPEDAYLVVQREAAERFAGGPYATETMWSLLLKPWWHVEIARRMSRSDFDPPPRVDSALLWLARRTRPLVEASERGLYRSFVMSSFGRRGNSVRRACVESLRVDNFFAWAATPGSILWHRRLPSRSTSGSACSAT
jgi:23S rRNA (adenine-N6)-dimethyltransferase